MRHVVNRGQGGNFFNFVDDGVCDKLRLCKEFRALHHAVANGADLAFILHHGALAGGHHFHNLHKGFRVGGEGHLLLPFFAVRLVHDFRALDADALAQALAQNGLAVHINQLILQ